MKLFIVAIYAFNFLISIFWMSSLSLGYLSKFYPSVHAKLKCPFFHEDVSKFLRSN